MRRVYSGLVLLMLIIGMLALTINIQPVHANATIYIKADGNIDPPDAQISTVDYVTYTLTGNIASDADGIVVERSDIVIDGNGYTLQGDWSYTGIGLSSRSNVTIKNMTIEAFYYAIYAGVSSGNSISENNIIVDNGVGILLGSSSNNSIPGNKITVNRGTGILLSALSNYTSIFGNKIDANNGYGISIYSSSNYNSIFGNNIANGLMGIVLDSSSNYNSVYGNKITHNGNGIYISVYSSYNGVYENEITANGQSIVFHSSSGNTIFHNSFINNSVPQAVCTSDSTDIFDNGYPSGGNYWSDYKGTDSFSGAYQNDTGSDGIGDTPYIIDANNRDRYPLMLRWGTGDINGDGKVTLVDLVLLANAYSSRPGEPKWNPNADINNNGIVDLPDLFLLAECYGEKYT